MQYGCTRAIRMLSSVTRFLSPCYACYVNCTTGKNFVLISILVRFYTLTSDIRRNYRYSMIKRKCRVESDLCYCSNRLESWPTGVVDVSRDGLWSINTDANHSTRIGKLDRDIHREKISDETEQLRVLCKYVAHISQHPRFWVTQQDPCQECNEFLIIITTDGNS